MATHGSRSLDFTEANIQAIFGHEAAEDEDRKRLREYYFKTSTYDRVITDLPLRLLVGHKGIGKSALFQVAMAEDEANDRMALVVKPDDVLDLSSSEEDFLKTIRIWREGLLELLTKKALTSLGYDRTDAAGRLWSFGGRLVDVIRNTIKDPKYVSLDPTKEYLQSRFLNESQISVYIDDLDRGWQGRAMDVRRISALLNAVRDIANENRGIFFRISLRSDVYFLVRTSDESTDKIEGSVVWQAWTNHEIFVMLLKRIETFLGRDHDYEQLAMLKQRELASYLDPVMERTFQGKGHWHNAPMYRVLMSLIRKRPRDLVKLCTLAARVAQARKSEVIRTGDFESVFEEYSQGRVQDTVNEFRSELPDIERLILNMKPNKRERTARSGYIYTTADLLQKIDNIRQGGDFRFKSGRIASNKELLQFMYKINFLTARRESGQWIARRYFEENRYLQSSLADFGFDWEIHPAYRWALQPYDISKIYATLELSADDD